LYSEPSTGDEPIVCSPEDAIRCFFSTNLDAVVIENFLIHKQSSQGLRLSGPKPSVLAAPRWFTLSEACQALVAGFIIDWRFGRGTAIATAGSLAAGDVRQLPWWLELVEFFAT